jgi:hypothetical protein
MKLKTNVIVGAIFALLLAFVYFHEIKGGQERRQAAERSKQLVDFKESEVERLSLIRPEGGIEVERTEGSQWRIVLPVEDGADGEAVERYLRNIAESEREKVVVDSADALSAETAARYGLDRPRLKVLIETEDGTLDTLLFGTDAPTDRYTYVQESGSNPEIFVVRAWRYDNLDKSVFDLRDRRVLAFPKSEVIEAARTGSAGPVSLRKEGTEWLMQEPIVARASSEAIDGLLAKIESSEISAFVDEAPSGEALSAYGFGPGAVQWSFALGQDRRERRLSIGREDEEGRYYARVESRPQVFLIDSTLVHRLSQDAVELRDRKPLRVDPDGIDRMEYRRGPVLIFAAEKDTSGVWNIQDPPGQQTKSWKLNALLTDLESLEAIDFATAQGGEPPLSVRLMEGGQSVNYAQFFLRDGEIYLEQDGDPHAYKIDTDVFADIDLELDEVRQVPEAVDSTRVDE